MQYRKLGASSINSSILGLGALHFGVYLDQKKTNEIVSQALDFGINFIDTAPQYGKGLSEIFIKQAIGKRRSQVFLTTKVGLKPTMTPEGYFGVETVALTKHNVRRALEESLKALGTDYIDLYQVHAFDPKTPLEETFSVLQSLIQEGKIRYIGCSNYDREQLEEAQRAVEGNGLTPFVSFQVHYNMIERRAENELIEGCRKYRLGIIVNRALARGILSGRYKAQQPPPEGSRAAESVRIRRWLEDDTLRCIDALNDFARERGYTVAQLALAWLTANPDVTVVLVGVRNSEHLMSCVQACEWRLSATELTQVDKILEKFFLLKQVKERPEVFFEK